MNLDVCNWLLGVPKGYTDAEAEVTWEGEWALAPFIKYGPVADAATTERLRCASLCSGVGCLEAGLSDVIDVCLCAEKDSYARAVLSRSIYHDGNWSACFPAGFYFIV